MTKISVRPFLLSLILSCVICASQNQDLSRDILHKFLRDFVGGEQFQINCEKAIAQLSNSCPSQQERQEECNLGRTNRIQRLKNLLQRHHHASWLQGTPVSESGKKSEESDDVKGDIHLMALDQSRSLSACVYNNKPVGPFVQRTSFSAELKYLNEEVKDEWLLAFQSAMYTKSDGRRYIMSRSFDRDMNCPIFYLDDQNRFYSVELLKVKEITGFVALDLSDPIEEEEVTLPQHLVQEYQDKIDLIALAKHTFKCSPSNREVIHSVIANKDLFDKGKFGKYPQITIHPQWSKILKNDPECRHFGELFWPPTGSVFKTLLASYPGSGSKWVMELFQLASGLGTTLSDKYVPLILQKTHHDLNINIKRAWTANEIRNVSLGVRMQEVTASGGRGVLLLRNPIEAIISWWNHVQSDAIITGGLSSDDLESSILSDKFCHFAQAEARIWRDLHLDWISMVPNLALFHFEHFKRDRVKETQRLLNFLRVPKADPARLRCLARHSFDLHKRKTKVSKSMLAKLKTVCPVAIALVEKAISDVSQLLESESYDTLPLELYLR